MGESNRVFITKEAIRQALLEKLNHQDIAHIKASEVIAAARVSKATFYRYYKDVYDVLMDCFSVYLDVQQETHKSAAEGNLIQDCYDLILMGLRKVQAYPQLYLLCITCAYTPFIADMRDRSISQSVDITEILISQLGLTAENCLVGIDTLAELCVDLSTDINVRWVQNNCQETPEEIAQLAYRCLCHFILSMKRDNLVHVPELFSERLF